MGKYINKTSKGVALSATGKVKELIKDGATIVNGKWQPNLICVVDNGHFEAAGYMYSKQEFNEFNYCGDFRPKTWLIHPNAAYLAE